MLLIISITHDHRRRSWLLSIAYCATVLAVGTVQYLVGVQIAVSWESDKAADGIHRGLPPWTGFFESVLYDAFVDWPFPVGESNRTAGVGYGCLHPEEHLMTCRGLSGWNTTVAPYNGITVLPSCSILNSSYSMRMNTCGAYFDLLRSVSSVWRRILEDGKVRGRVVVYRRWITSDSSCSCSCSSDYACDITVTWRWPIRPLIDLHFLQWWQNDEWREFNIYPSDGTFCYEWKLHAS